MSEYKILNNNSENLIICFGGMALKMGGILPFEFLNYLSNIYKKNIDLYFYIDKNQSLITEEARKDFLKEKLLSSITIKNEEGKDVKFNKQFFPSRFQGMPNKIIVVVPSIGFQEQINAEVNVESMIQLQLIVSLDKIKTLPKISI